MSFVATAFAALIAYAAGFPIPSTSLEQDMTNEEQDDQSPPPPQPPMSGGMSMSFDMPSEPAKPGTPAPSSSEPSMRMDAASLEISPSPFRIVVLDEFCGDATPPARPQTLTTASIDDAMNTLGARVAVAVPNHLASKPKELTAELRFGCMRDFSPKRLLAQIPELQAANDLYNRLGDLVAGRITAAQLESELDSVGGFDKLIPALNLALKKPASPTSTSASTPTPPPANDEQATKGRSLLNELLDMDMPTTPSEPAPPPQSARSAIDSFAGSIAGRGPSSNTANVTQAMELVGNLLACQLQEFLHAQAVRTIECAWRSVQFLATQASGRDGQPVRIEVQHATANDFADVFAKSVHAPECAGEPAHALSLTVLGCDIHNNAAHLEALREVQAQSEDLQAPFLWSMDPTFLGASAQELAGRDSVSAVLGSSELAKWRGLRNEETSRWSGACFNRFLLRNLHTGNVGQWPLAESANHLWGSPSFFVAGLIARSVIDTGWPSRFTGLRAGGIEGRPIADQKPVEAALGESAIEDLADSGIMALTCKSGRDEVVLLRAPSVHEAAQFGNREQANADSRKMSSLPFQLLASRIAETTMRYKPALVSDGNPNAMKQRFELFLHALIGDTGAGSAASVSIEPDADGNDSHWVHCSVRTGREILGGAEVQFSLRG